MISKSFFPSVRYVHGMRIYFKSKAVVEVTENNQTININRWHQVGGGTYRTAWKPFCEKLRRYNNIENIYQVMALAHRYGLNIVSVPKPERLSPTTQVHPTKYIWPKRRATYGNFPTN